MFFLLADENEHEESEAQPVLSFNIVLKSLPIMKDIFSYNNVLKNLAIYSSVYLIVIQDLDDYIRENLVTIEVERTIAPYVDDLMDFSFTEEKEHE